MSVTFVINTSSFFYFLSQALPAGHQVYLTQGHCHESAGQVVQQLQRPWRSQHAPGVEPVCYLPNDNDGLQHGTTDVDTQCECLFSLISVQSLCWVTLSLCWHTRINQAFNRIKNLHLHDKSTENYLLHIKTSTNVFSFFFFFF